MCLLFYHLKPSATQLELSTMTLQTNPTVPHVKFVCITDIIQMTTARSPDVIPGNLPFVRIYTGEITHEDESLHCKHNL